MIQLHGGHRKDKVVAITCFFMETDSVILALMRRRTYWKLLINWFDLDLSVTAVLVIVLVLAIIASIITIKQVKICRSHSRKRNMFMSSLGSLLLYVDEFYNDLVMSSWKLQVVCYDLSLERSLFLLAVSVCGLFLARNIDSYLCTKMPKLGTEVSSGLARSPAALNSSFSTDTFCTDTLTRESSD